LVLAVLVVTEDQPEDQEPREFLERRDLRAHRVRTVRRDPLGRPVHQGTLERAGQTEIQGSRASRERRDPPDLRDLQDLQDLTARQAIAVLMETLAHKDRRVPKATLDREVPRVPPGLLVRPESRVILVIQVCRVLRE